MTAHEPTAATDQHGFETKLTEADRVQTQVTEVRQERCPRAVQRYLDTVKAAGASMRYGSFRVAGAKRVIVAMQHTAKGRPKIVRECSLPLTSSRPVDLVVTELAVIGFPGGRATLLETQDGVSVEEVVAATEAELAISPELSHSTIPKAASASAGKSVGEAL